MSAADASEKSRGFVGAGSASCEPFFPLRPGYG